MKYIVSKNILLVHGVTCMYDRQNDRALVLLGGGKGQAGYELRSKKIMYEVN